jgi:hypothetical protein
MLTYADVCLGSGMCFRLYIRRMLTYADVCLGNGMCFRFEYQTYADVC